MTKYDNVNVSLEKRAEIKYNNHSFNFGGQMENILVSSCLLGRNCKYDGKNNLNVNIKALENKYKIIEICPECLGGLSTPRDPSEIKEGKVYSSKGKDVTTYFLSGAEKALELARENGCKIAILKALSPSCGYGEIYDGSFAHKKIEGNGITASLLSENQIKIYNEKNFEEMEKDK